MPEHSALSPDGLLLLANGIDPVLRWDGWQDEAEPAGVIAPASACSFTGSGVGSITGTYYAFVRYVDRDGNYSDLSALSSGVTLASSSTINYASVPFPTQEKVVRRQILRNTAGQTAVFYVDIDTEDLTSSTFTSTLTDTTLQVQTAVSLFDSSGNILANLHGVPPSSRKCLAAHLDRMFAAGEEIYVDGNVIVTLGSTTVTGIQTQWPDSFQGRFLWVAGADKAYEISSVDPSAQTLTLVEAYSAATQPYASYAIRPPEFDRRLVYYTEAGLPESWPAVNAFAIQEDNDEITGLMAKGSFLFVLEAMHIYRFTFERDPATDGYVFLTASRGCVNQRSWVSVDENAYFLDRAGIYAFSSGQDTQPLSGPIQDLFEGSSPKGYRIHWDASRWFHACYDPGLQVVRWFVALSGVGVPRHALCFSLTLQRWWIEEYPVPIGASTTLTLGGVKRVILGGPAGEVYLLGEKTLDRVDAHRGTVRGSVTSSSPTSLSDVAATFGDDLTNAPVVIISGRGKGEIRKVTNVSGTTLYLDRPWAILPDTTSVYQVGGIPFRWRSGWMRWADDDTENPRRLEILFEPCEQDALLDARLYVDRSRTARTWGTTLSSTTGGGFASTKGETDLVGDLTRENGFLQKRMDSQKDIYLDGPRLLSLELGGATNQDEVRIYQITLDGAGNGDLR